MFEENTLSESIGKASSKFVGVPKESVEWNYTFGTNNNRNEVNDSVNRRSRFKMINIKGRNKFCGSEMQGKMWSLDVRSALNGNHNGRLKLI